MSNDSNPTRKKHTGEPGNGGQFGHARREDGIIVLTVEERKAAEEYMDETWDTDPSAAHAVSERIAEIDAAAAAAGLAPTGDLLDPVDTSDPRLQTGHIFDTIVGTDGRNLHRLRAGWTASHPTKLRVQASRELTDAEAEQLGKILDFQLNKVVIGESSGAPERDSPYSLVLDHDSLPGRRTPEVIAHRYANMVRKLNEYVRRGSEAAGLGGDTSIPGLGDTDLTFEVYTDSVALTAEPAMWTAEEIRGF